MATPEPQLSSDARAIIDAVERLAQPRLVDVQPGDAGRHVLVTAKGQDVRSVKEFLDDYLTAPERRRGVAHVFDLASFIDHAKRFADPASAIFADPDRAHPKILAVLDYHQAGPDGKPRYGEHRTCYECPLSEEWKAWASLHGRTLSQRDFAAFIEDRITDLISPEQAGAGALELARALDTQFATPVKIMEYSRQLSVRVNHQVQSAVNLNSGEATIHYSSEHQDAKSFQPLRVPSAFLIAIPVFKNGDRFQIAVRLRYNVDPPKITWSYTLYRADLVFDLAFKEMCDEAAEATSLPLFLGTPEDANED